MTSARPPASAQARELALGLGVSVTLGELLLRRGHRDLEQTRRFLNPRLSELTAPTAMADRSLAAERMARAIRAGELIAVFGDYDCDGMTSAAIMTEVIEALGGRAVTLIASRFEGGYGLSSAAADKVLQSGAPLLVTCDCGSSDHVSLERLRGAGVDCVVIDHHLVPEQALPVVAFLNPHRPSAAFRTRGWHRVGSHCRLQLPCAQNSDVSSICVGGSTWWRLAPSPTSLRWMATIERWFARGSKRSAKGGDPGSAPC